MKNMILPVKYELQSFDEDPRFLKLKLYIMHSKINPNRSNFEMDVIEDAKDSLFNIPMLAYIAEDENGNKDFTEHEMELVSSYPDEKIKYLEQPVGVLPLDNDYHYEDIDGRAYVVANCYIWRNYCQDAVDILEKNDGAKISMEIEILDYEYDKKTKILDIKRYRYTGITFLGKKIQSGMINAHAELIANFSCEDERFCNLVQELNFSLHKNRDGEIVMEFIKKEDIGSGEKIEIDNSKDNANTSGSWGDINKTSLRNKILEASNYKSLVKEAYLIVDDGFEDSPSESLHYPHHEISNGKLVVHQAGCEAALQRLHGQGIDSGAPINHLKKHYKELGLSTENFALEGGNKLENFKLTHGQLFDEMARELSEVKFMGETWWSDSPVEMQKYILRDGDESFAYVMDCQNGYMDMKVPYSMNGDNVEFDFENAKRIKYSPVDWEGQDDKPNPIDQYTKNLIETFKVKHEEILSKEKETFAETLTEKNSAIEGYRVQISELDQSYSTKITELEQLNNELTQFKANKLQEEKQVQIEAVFALFNGKLTTEEMVSIREKSMEMDTKEIEEKLFALVGRKNAQFSSNTQQSNHVFMGLGGTENNSSNVEKSIWQEQKEKYETK